MKRVDHFYFVFTNPPTKGKKWNLNIGIPVREKATNGRGQKGWLINMTHPVKKIMKNLRDKNKGKGLKLYVRQEKQIPIWWKKQVKK